MRIDRRSVLLATLAASVLPRSMRAQDEAASDPSDPPWTILSGNDSGPRGRWGHALVADPVNNRLLLIGGRDEQGTVKGDLWSYDLGGNAWSDLDLSGPKARAGSAVATTADGSGFYYFGGASDDTVFDDLWWFDFANATWQEITPSSVGPKARFGVRGAIDAYGRFVVTHGQDGDTLFDDTWAYDPTAKTWTDISPDPALRPMARYDHDFLALPDYGLLLLTGGCSDGIGPCPQGDLWALDVTGGGWVDITPATAPTPRTGSVAAQLGSTTLQVGGLTDLGPESDVWRGYFDGGTIGWGELTLVNHGPMGIDRRSGHAMTTGGNEFFVFGGEGVEGPLSDLWQFSLDRYTESEHTVDPSSDFNDSGSYDDSESYDDSGDYVESDDSGE